MGGMQPQVGSVGVTKGDFVVGCGIAPTDKRGQIQTYLLPARRGGRNAIALRHSGEALEG